jgi:hypothetical protein
MLVTRKKKSTSNYHTREGDEGVGLSGHLCFPLVHVGDGLELPRRVADQLPREHRLGHHTQDVPAAVVDGAGDEPHQTHATAAVHQVDTALHLMTITVLDSLLLISSTVLRNSLRAQLRKQIEQIPVGVPAGWLRPGTPPSSPGCSRRTRTPAGTAMVPSSWLPATASPPALPPSKTEEMEKTNNIRWNGGEPRA